MPVPRWLVQLNATPANATIGTQTGEFSLIPSAPFRVVVTFSPDAYIRCNVDGRTHGRNSGPWEVVEDGRGRSWMRCIPGPAARTVNREQGHVQYKVLENTRCEVNACHGARYIRVPTRENASASNLLEPFMWRWSRNYPYWRPLQVLNSLIHLKAPVNHHWHNVYYPYSQCTKQELVQYGFVEKSGSAVGPTTFLRPWNALRLYYEPILLVPEDLPQEVVRHKTKLFVRSARLETLYTPIADLDCEVSKCPEIKHIRIQGAGKARLHNARGRDYSS